MSGNLSDAPAVEVRRDAETVGGIGVRAGELLGYRIPVEAGHAELLAYVGDVSHRDGPVADLAGGAALALLKDAVHKIRLVEL